MQLFLNPSLDPAYNLALEEYAFTSMSERLLILWRNRPSVIIGRNQNIWAEVNLDYARAHDLPVVRRLSGGVAVYHDLGNVNYSLARELTPEQEARSAFLEPLKGYLARLGLAPADQGRNDLIINGRKFCGMASAHRPGRSLIHACILFNADLEKLTCVLQPAHAKLAAKGVTSARGRVGNLVEQLVLTNSAEEFMQGLATYCLENMPGLKLWQPQAAIQAQIERLAQEKYAAWDWNYGRSPAGAQVNCRRFDFGTVEIYWQVRQGRIASIAIYGDFFGDVQKLEQVLLGARPERRELLEILTGIDLPSYIQGMSHEQLLEMLL